MKKLTASRTIRFGLPFGLLGPVFIVAIRASIFWSLFKLPELGRIPRELEAARIALTILKGLSSTSAPDGAPRVTSYIISPDTMELNQVEAESVLVNWPKPVLCQSENAGGVFRINCSTLIDERARLSSDRRSEDDPVLVRVSERPTRIRFFGLAESWKRVNKVSSLAWETYINEYAISLSGSWPPLDAEAQAMGVSAVIEIGEPGVIHFWNA